LERVICARQQSGFCRVGLDRTD